MITFELIPIILIFLLFQLVQQYPIIGPSGLTVNLSTYFARLPTKDSPHLYYIYQARIYRLDLSNTSSLSPVSLGPSGVDNHMLKIVDDGGGGTAALTIENLASTSTLKLYNLNVALTTLTLGFTITVPYKINKVIVGRGNNILVIPEDTAKFPKMTKIDFAGNNFQALAGEATVMDRVRTAIGFDAYWLMISAPDVDDQSPGN